MQEAEKEKFKKAQVKTYRDLNVYKQSFEVAMGIFYITRTFPREERYALVDQITKAARSIPTNIAEGWAKRNYEKIFKRHLLDAIGSCEEMKVWLDFALKCHYLEESAHKTLLDNYTEIGAMLASLADKWQTF